MFLAPTILLALGLIILPALEHLQVSRLLRKQFLRAPHEPG
jgi:hypothetical protein